MSPEKERAELARWSKRVFRGKWPHVYKSKRSGALFYADHLLLAGRGVEVCYRCVPHGPGPLPRRRIASARVFLLAFELATPAERERLSLGPFSRFSSLTIPKPKGVQHDGD